MTGIDDDTNDHLRLYDQSEHADRSYDASATPTTAAIRATYATDYYMTEVRSGVTIEERAAAFDRWLAAHDAQVRAGAAAEEPEWEYTYMRPDTGYPDDFAGLPADRETAEEMAATFPGEGELLRRVVSGPWIPVDDQATTSIAASGEGAGHACGSLPGGTLHVLPDGSFHAEPPNRTADQETHSDTTTR